jgi:hypothetical protein
MEGSKPQGKGRQQRRGRRLPEGVVLTAPHPARPASVHPGKRKRPRVTPPPGSPGGPHVPAGRALPLASPETPARPAGPPGWQQRTAGTIPRGPPQGCDRFRVRQSALLALHRTVHAAPTEDQVFRRPGELESPPASRQASPSASSGPQRSSLSRSSRIHNGSPVSSALSLASLSAGSA